MSSEILRVDNPFTGEIVAERPLLDAEGIDQAIERAHHAHLLYRRTPLGDRIALVERFCRDFLEHADLYATEISASMGKPIKEARAEVNTMVDRARQMSSIAEQALADDMLPAKDGFVRFIRREPVGVVVVIAAWNYPLLIAINPIVAAILAGDAVVLKHSSRTPRAGEQFQEAFLRAGAPEGLLVSVHASHAVTEHLVTHPRVGYVSFTGSVGGGREVYRAVANKRFIDVGLELGGKDPAYVTADAPFDFSVNNVVEGAMYNAGQSCCGIERVYVEASIYDRFLEAAIAVAKQDYRPGDPSDPATTFGPMAQPNAPKTILGQVEEARRLGARVILGGKPTQLGGRGRFFEPTIVADTDHRMAVAREETFGPVVAIQKVKDDQEAIARMNDSAYGLTASVWTKDVERGTRILDQLDAGTVYLNRCDYLDPLLAWTGVKDSGKGASLSKLGFLSVTRPKSFHLRTKTP
jgi:acyl-CoA reductase-like NAD-dependent aldehyde dehydrogenase